MGMTMSQKILAAHAGLDSVAAGQLISAKLDIVLGREPMAGVNRYEKALSSPFRAGSLKPAGV